MSNAFEKFGGILEEPAPTDKKKQVAAPKEDMFKAFGGQVEIPAPEAAAPKPDPFAAFGGQAESSLNVEPKQEKAPVPEVLPDADLQKLAAKYGIDPEFARSVAPYMGVTRDTPLMELPLEGVKYAAGSAARIGTFGLGPKAYIKAQEDPNKRAFLDELREIGAEQRGLLTNIAEGIVAPAGVLGKAAEGTGTAAKVAQAAIKTAPRRVAIGAATGAAAGLGASREGEEGKAIATGAALGGALGTAAEGVGLLVGKGTRGAKTLGEISEEAAKKPRLQQTDAEAAIAAERSGTAELDDVLQDYVLGTKKIEQATPRELEVIQSNLPKNKSGEAIDITEEVAKRRANLAEELQGRPVAEGEAVEDILKEAQARGNEYLASRYQAMLDIQAAERAAEKGTLRADNTTGLLGSIRDRNLYTPTLLQKYDDTFNTSLAQNKALLSRNRNIMNINIDNLRKDRLDIANLAKEEKYLPYLSNGNVLVQAIERGKTSQLTPEGQKIASTVSKYMEKVRQIANSAEKEGVVPLNIPKIDNYMTRTPKETAEIISTVDATAAQAVEDIAARLGRPIDNLSQVTNQDMARLTSRGAVPKSVDDLMEFISWKNQGRLPAPTSGQELQARINEAISGNKAAEVLETLSRSTLNRKGKIPEFIRETRLPHILDRYTKDVLSDLYQRVPIDRLRADAKKIRLAGGTREADIIDNLITDSIATREGTYKSGMRRINIAANRATQKAINTTSNPVTKGALEVVKASPGFLDWASRRVYNNLLGSLRIAPAFKNVIGNYIKVTSELGQEYGNSVYFRAFIDATANFKKYAQIARKEGHLPGEFLQGTQADLREGVFASKPVRMGEKGIEVMEKVGMTFQQATETFNHAVALSASNIMARDLAKGTTLALNRVSEFPKQIQQQLITNIRQNNPQANQKLLMDYFKERILLTYDIPSKAQFARTVGPMLSTFSTWPTGMAAELAYDLQSRGAAKGIKKQLDRYLLPVLVGYSVDKIMQEKYPEYEYRRRLFLGAGGLASALPVDAYKSWIRGDQFTPPVVDVTSKVGGAVAKGDGRALVKGVDTAAQLFVPGAGYLDNFFNVWVNALTEQPNEGSTKTEKIIEGMQRTFK
jgi:hypothetical protein